MNKKYLAYTLILATIGFLISLLLAKVGINLVNDPSFKSFCNINASFNCDAVALSKYSSHFGIPNFAYGIGYYFIIIIFISYILYKNNKFLPNILVYVFWMSLGSLVVSLYLFIISHLLIKTLCVLCMLIYFVNIMMFLVAFMSEKWSILNMYNKLVADIKLYFSSGGRTFIFILILLNVIGALYYFNSNPIIVNKASAEGNTSPTQQEEYNIDYTKANQDRLVLGTAVEPTITILVFTDYECSHCSIASQELNKLLKLNPDIRVIFKDYPLDQTCNQRMRRPFHQYACKASLSARCAAEQGKFWEYHDLLFANQNSIDNAKLRDIANQLNLDMNKFNECVKSEKYINNIITDIDEGAALGLEGTPTFYIEGKKIEGFRTATELQKIINDLKLEKQKQLQEREKAIQEVQKNQPEPKKPQ